MQWLIDILAAKVIAEIGVPPCYIDRGTYTDFDFELADLTTDAAWHELDLSGIIDEGATAVVIRVKARATITGKFIRFRKPGTTMTLYTCEFRTQVANLYTNTQPVIGVDTNRKIEYFMPANHWTDLDMVIRGWFM